MERGTRERLLELVEDNDVEFIRLQFTDMLGNLKNIAITSSQLEDALDNKCLVDVSSIAGFREEEDADMYLYPDPDTFVILPWRPQQGRVARLLCDIYTPEHEPYAMCCRQILDRVLKKAKEEGYSFYVEPECEFFLFHTDENGIPTTLTHERAGYLDIGPVDFGENARRDIVLNLEDMGFEVTSSHHESVPAQHEVDFHTGKAMKTADMIMTFKMAVRSIAKRHGLHATFMPKPRTDTNGSGMHVHMSLYKDGRNVFYDPKDKRGLSQEAYYFLGGLLHRCRSMAVFTNPLVNSYKRLQPGYDAPTKISWQSQDRNALIRLPRRVREDPRIELRSPDAASNPYLVFALCLAAGLEGIHQKRMPGKEQEDSLPENLKEAIWEAEQDTWLGSVLGEQFLQRYLEEKKGEWKEYAKQVSNWERELYLYRY